MRVTKKRIMALAIALVLALGASVIAAAAGPVPIGDFDLIETPFGVSRKKLLQLHGEPHDHGAFDAKGFHIESMLYERPDGRKSLYCFVDDAFAYAMEERAFYVDSNEAYDDFKAQSEEMTLWYDDPFEQGTWQGDEWSSSPVLSKPKRFSAQWDFNAGKSELSSYWQEGDRCVMTVSISKVVGDSKHAFVMERHYYDPVFFDAYRDADEGN